MGDVVQLPVIRVERSPGGDERRGNGAREAMKVIAPNCTDDEIDRFLARLWQQGFKMVPLEFSDFPDGEG